MTQSGDEHITFLKFMLGVCEKWFFNFTALIGADYSANRSIATELNKPLLGCISHSFQLAIREVIEQRTNVVPRVHNLIIRLRTLLLRA